MSDFLRVIRYILPFKGYAALNIISNILAVFFSLFSLVMVGPFLEILFETKEVNIVEKPVVTFSNIKDSLVDFFYYQLQSIIDQYGKLDALLFICILVATFIFLKNLFRFLGLYFMAPIRNGVIRDIRNQLFTKITSLPLGYFSEEKKGDILTRATSDVQEIEWSILSVLESTFREPVAFAAYLTAMLMISPVLTLFVFTILPLTGIVIARVAKSLKKSSHDAQSKLSLLMSIIDETISGLRIVKGFNAIPFQNRKFQNENHSHFDLMNKVLRRKDLSSPLAEFLSILVVCIVLYIGGRMVLNGEGDLQPQGFIVFMVIFSQIIPPARSFATAFFNIQKGMASVERVNKILDAHNDIEESTNPKVLNNFNESITFNKVSFAYQEQLVLKNINFVLKKGQILALVGASGAGKSTIADLIPRFYDVNEGEVMIDGVDIKQYRLEDLRKLMGIVSQEAMLFNDTVFSNIAFGIERKIELKEVIQAAKVANAHDFIMQLSNGYDTLVGDRGSKLSGGERQRLTIARAVLKNPPILILDEATSSLDAASEKLVQDALFKLMQNRTSIVIAHRLSTIQFADEILVMKNGTVVEQGTHQELLTKGGTYEQLVKLQAF
ncbi:MAG: ABC transporter ATP-binding protein [Chitinophagales bacterium]